MSSKAHSKLLSLKNADAALIAEGVQGVAAEVSNRAAALRSLLAPEPTSLFVFRASVPDSAIVQAVLLAILLDEISFSADPRARTEAFKEIESACENLGLSFQDILAISRRTAELLSALQL